MEVFFHIRLIISRERTLGLCAVGRSFLPGGDGQLRLLPPIPSGPQHGSSQPPAGLLCEGKWRRRHGQHADPRPVRLREPGLRNLRKLGVATLLTWAASANYVAGWALVKWWGLEISWEWRRVCAKSNTASSASGPFICALLLLYLYVCINPQQQRHLGLRSRAHRRNIFSLLRPLTRVNHNKIFFFASRLMLHLYEVIKWMV